jgi:hypothetical protein
MKSFPMTYTNLLKALADRYEDFSQNTRFQRLKRRAEADKRYAILRYINPLSPNSTKQRFYNANIFQEFDKHYTRKKK